MNPQSDGPDNQASPITSEVASVHPRAPTPAAVVVSSNKKTLSVLSSGQRYPKIGKEHNEMIQDGVPSREIITHLGKYFNIESWEKGEFLGELQILPTPKEKESVYRLREYLASTNPNFKWSLANGGSPLHPQFYLLDAYAIEALVGAENMEKANAILEQLHNAWQATRKDEPQKEKEYAEKETLLKKALGLMSIDWTKLVGVRASNGKFEGGGGLRINGKLDKTTEKVNRLWLTKRGPRDGSVVGLSPASYGGLFSLAVPENSPTGE